MSLHLIKLSVGPTSLAELSAWQQGRLRELKARGKPPELIHITRQTPKRAEELLAGGSIYWVIGGWVVARQRLLELRPLLRDGVPHCGLVYDKKMVQVSLRPHRPFQGWRYLDARDAPADLVKGSGEGAMPAEMRQQLKALGLL